MEGNVPPKNQRPPEVMSEFWFTFSRGGGPGGQNVNKVNSKATLHWVPTGSRLPADWVRRFLAKFGNRVNQDGIFQISSQEFRDQGRNREDCREKFFAMLASVAAPPKRRKKTRPTFGSTIRRREAKQHQGEKKKNRSGSWE